MTDEQYIEKALKLAKKGKGYVSPNPLVGAVLVKNGRVIGEGYHKRFGGLHAEVEALKSATEEVKGATLYVTLEPCAHFGKQPPCVHSILEAGVQRVVIGTKDPNPLVNGKGIRFLKDHGINVTVGVKQKACQKLNEAYFKFITTRLPFTTVKIAQTLDAKIATLTGQSRWITSEAARKQVHILRHEHDAILVGIETVLKDNPALTVRLLEGVNPKRFVLDSYLRIPLDCQLLSDSEVRKTIVVTLREASKEKIEQIQSRGAEVWQLPAGEDGKIALPELWKKMGEGEIASLLIEGGSQVFTSVIKEKLVDRVIIFVAPKLLGAGIDCLQDLGIRDLKQAVVLKDLECEKLGPDLMITGKIG